MRVEGLGAVDVPEECSLVIACSLVAGAASALEGSLQHGVECGCGFGDVSTVVVSV